MLERNDIKVLFMDEIDRCQIAARVLLRDRPANMGWIGILPTLITHRNDCGLGHVIKVAHGQFKISSEGCDATPAGQGITDEGNPKGLILKIVLELAFRLARRGQYRRTFQRCQRHDGFALCGFRFADLSIAAFL